jgi:hypothetical protein
LNVSGASGLLLSVPGDRIPSSSVNPAFLGVITTVPITEVEFDASNDTDNVAIRDFELVCESVLTTLGN